MNKGLLRRKRERELREIEKAFPRDPVSARRQHQIRSRASSFGEARKHLLRALERPQNVEQLCEAIDNYVVLRERR